MVNYTDRPNSGALPHPWGIAPTHWVWKHHVQFLPSGDDYSSFGHVCVYTYI